MTRAAAVVLLTLASPAAAGQFNGVEDPVVTLLKGSGQFGTFRADIEIKNPNAFDIKDTQVACFAYAQSGTRIADYLTTIYQTVPANGAIKARNVRIGAWPEQAATAACSALVAKRQTP